MGNTICKSLRKLLENAVLLTNNFLVDVTSSTFVSNFSLNPCSFKKQYSRVKIVYYQRIKPCKNLAWLFNSVFGVLYTCFDVSFV